MEGARAHRTAKCIAGAKFVKRPRAGAGRLIEPRAAAYGTGYAVAHKPAAGTSTSASTHRPGT